ncbi:complement C2 [Aulostomus maculatus]
MAVRSILWILLCFSVQKVSMQEDENDFYEAYDDPLPLNCSTSESIKGGHVTYSQGGLEGSVLTYHCGPGKYPFPLSYRLCGADGEWSPMRSTYGRVLRATCKDVVCPGQLQLDHGDFWPRDQWFGVGTTQSFSCQDGFTLYGSAQRNCTLSGEWTGTTPICDNHAEDCNNPGTPAGAQRLGNRFHTGEKVIYRCLTGLDLLGSSERVCLESREWSGATPRCQGRNSFDSPGVVTEAMAGSLAGVMDVLTPDSKKKGSAEIWIIIFSFFLVTFARTFRVAEGSRMNVYILLDTSGSIEKQDFEKSREATIALIRKLDSYEVQMKFHILSFASEVKTIVNIRETDLSGDSEHVILSLMDFDYHSHGRKTGTNIYAALQSVKEEISFFRESRVSSHFNETQNIIIIQTDGFSNTGGSPRVALAQIRHLLGYSNAAHDHTNERRLDVYVFGIGREVNKDELNSLASRKRNEMHVFILENYETLGEVFNSIISDQSVTMCGVAQEKVSKYKPAYTRPWHVTLPSVSCSGSIVSENWVLTAAHCFNKLSMNTVPQQVEIQYGGGRTLSKRVIIHPQFNIKALKHRNVSEFYDYDVALIQVNKSIPLSWQARPICMPCTVPASRALKKIHLTCQETRKELLSHETTAASFIHKNTDRKDTHIQIKSQRPGCVEKAKQTLVEPTNVTMDEYVPRRFLCSGGSSGFKDSVTCKGDSGGSLFLQKRQRYFQVGVVSWGTINVCDRLHSNVRYSVDSPPPDARDFHIDVFEIIPWLRQHLGREIQFLPDDN